MQPRVIHRLLPGVLGLTLAGCHALLSLHPPDRGTDGSADTHRELGSDQPADLRHGERPRDLRSDLDPIRPPRPLAPLSGSLSRGERVSLTWELPAGIGGAQLELVSDAGTTQHQVVGGSWSIDKSSLGGARYLTWRLRGVRDGVVGDTASPAWRLWLGTGKAAGSSAAWGTVPDLDGDGFADLIVGAPASSTAEVRVYRGSAAKLSATPDYTLTRPGEVSFGSSLAVVDLDGDGALELVVGAPKVQAGPLAGAGRVAIYRAVSASKVSWLEGTQASGGFGVVAGLGDFDGDGYGDLAVGEPGYTDAGSSASGRVLLYRGGSGGVPVLSSTLTGSGADKLGVRVAAAGDVNGDGRADLLVADNSGKVLLCAGAASPGTTLACTTLPKSYAGFGQSLAGVGDLDGDGFADAIVAAPAEPLPYSSSGVLLLFLGSASGLKPGGTVTWGSHTAFGSVLACAGDLDGDGRDDLVVAAMGAVAFYRVLGASYTFSSHGAVFDSSVASYGAALAGLGDVDGDGHSDAVIGVPNQAGVTPVYGAAASVVGATPVSGAAGSGFGSAFVSIF